jgi:hypothetical protein
MIYVKKYAFCDGCKMKLATKIVGEASTVNKEMSELLYRNGWRFDGPNRVYCPECFKRRATHARTESPDLG